MSKKKIIISVILLVVLVAAGIILPRQWKAHKQSEQKKTPSSTEESTELESSTDTAEESNAESETESGTGTTDDTLPEIAFQDFERMSEFLSNIQTEDLKQLFQIYFKESDMDTTAVTFLPDETTYPDGDSTQFLFSLSDGSKFPVTYLSSSGAFYFGEEKILIKSDSHTYERETDNNLPPVSEADVNAQPEGGYADTAAQENISDQAPADPAAVDEAAEATADAAEDPSGEVSE